MNKGKDKSPLEKTQASLQKLKENALKLLSRRDHSAQELKSKLGLRYLVSDETFEELLRYLKKFDYLVRPEILASRLVKAYQTQGRGARWIEGKLKTKGLSMPEVSDEEVKEIDAAKIFLARKLRGKCLAELTSDEKVKMMRSLVVRGFSHSLVADVMTDKNQN